MSKVSDTSPLAQDSVVNDFFITAPNTFLRDLGMANAEVRMWNRSLWNNKDKGSALSALARRTEALECFDKALAIDPRFAMACENKGRELQILGRLEEALRCYDIALSLDSRDAGAWCGKGGSLASSAQHSQALICFERALALEPNSAAALFGKAISEEMEGRLSEAASTLRSFIDTTRLSASIQGT